MLKTEQKYFLEEASSIAIESIMAGMSLSESE